jgi:hypothetical protein
MITIQLKRQCTEIIEQNYKLQNENEIEIPRLCIKKCGKKIFKMFVISILADALSIAPQDLCLRVLGDKLRLFGVQFYTLQFT